MTDGCVFCRIAAGDLPATVVHRDEMVVAFRDANPQAPTHILVVPRRHIASASHLGDGEGVLVARIVAVATSLAGDEGLARGYRLVFNVGPDGGQTVDHLHLHLLGGRPMAWPPG